MERINLMHISEALLIFTREKLYIKGVCEGTILSYKNAVISVQKVLGDIDIRKLTLNDVYTWKKACLDSGVIESTIRGRLICLRLILKHVERRVELLINPDDISLPKSPRRLPAVITRAEAERILQATKTLRDRLVIYLLFSTGLRIDELCGIRVRNIQENKIFVVGKGGKERYVFLDDTAIQLLHMYLPVDSEWLFSWQGQRINNNSIRVMIKRTAVKAGIKKNIYPHMFRHGFATNLLQNGLDIRYIQQLLGHEYITTTQIYTHVTNVDLQEKFEKYHVGI